MLLEFETVIMLEITILDDKYDTKPRDLNQSKLTDIFSCLTPEIEFTASMRLICHVVNVPQSLIYINNVN